MSVAAAENGRATSGALCCIEESLFVSGKFNEASTFEILINTGNYRLVYIDLTAAQINGGLTLWKYFEAEGENGPESLFEVQYTDVEGGNYEQLQFIECSSRMLV
jgi:hypothetical protein